ncbi:hypothetical protein JYU20_01165 [Bacteroidales bacterium AH-315-I05]|nr:hypothetical protein [Bacteroidales bacterium AH-315-I05]
MAGVRQWATYFGGTGNDLSNACHSDGTNLWTTGTAGNGFITLDPGGGAYYDGTGNANSDIFISQFSASSCPCAQSGSGTIWNWNGCASTDWFDACNWDRQILPTLTSDVIIPNTTNKPLVTGGTADCNTIEIQSSSGARLDLNSTGGGIINIAQ